MTTRGDDAGDARGEGRDPGEPRRLQDREEGTEDGRSDLPAIDPERLAEAKRLGRLAAGAAVSRNGHNAVLLEVTGRCSYTDYILVVEAESDRQVDALSDRIQKTLRQEGTKPLGIEGRGDGGWVLLDFGDLVVHVFRGNLRSFYDIEGLWHGVPEVDLSDLQVAVDGSQEAESDDWDDEW